MKAFMLTLLSSSLLFLHGCTATHSVSIGSLNKTGQKVTAKTSAFNFMNLTPISLEQSSSVIESLNSQCGNRGVTGITTKTSSTYLFIGMSEKVEASGYCK